MALSAAAIISAAKVAFYLAEKVLGALRAVSQAHLQRQQEIQLLIQLQGKLNDRWTAPSLSGLVGRRQ